MKRESAVVKEMFSAFGFFVLLSCNQCMTSATELRPVSISSFQTRTIMNNCLRVHVLALLHTNTGIKAAQALEQKPSLNTAEFMDVWPYQKESDFLPYLDAMSVKGDVDSVINAMDSFANVYPMYKLSPLKAAFLSQRVVNCDPKQILEVGTFFGYSALHIARVMPNGCTLTCIEANEANVQVAKAVLLRAFSGNQDLLKRIHILTGISSKILAATEANRILREPANILGEFRSDIGRNSDLFDFVFFDHDKQSYLPDLIALENKHLLGEKCVVIADNVIYPGTPEFLQYIGGSSSNIAESASPGRWQTYLQKMPFERIGFETNFKQVDDAMSVSVLMQ